MSWWIYLLLPFAMLGMVTVWVGLMELRDRKREQKLAKRIVEKYRAPLYAVRKGEVRERPKWD